MQSSAAECWQLAPAWPGSQAQDPSALVVPVEEQVALSENWQLVPACPGLQAQEPSELAAPVEEQVALSENWQLVPAYPGLQAQEPSKLTAPVEEQVALPENWQLVPAGPGVQPALGGQAELAWPGPGLGAPAVELMHWHCGPAQPRSQMQAQRAPAPVVPWLLHTVAPAWPGPAAVAGVSVMP